MQRIQDSCAAELVPGLLYAIHSFNANIYIYYIHIYIYMHGFIRMCTSIYVFQAC